MSTITDTTTTFVTASSCVWYDGSLELCGTQRFASYAEARFYLAMDIVDTGLLEMGPADAESAADWLAAAADLLRSTGPEWRHEFDGGCSYWISCD